MEPSASRRRGAYETGSAAAPPPEDCERAAAYRDEFRRRGSTTIFSPETFDARRMASWAPYLVVPTAFFLTNRAPKEYRVHAWASSLVVFGVCSCIMYNTDTR